MDIVIDDDEAPIVKKIFEMTVKEGYGSYRMADYLNSHGIRTHNNSKFQCNTVNRILKNRLIAVILYQAVLNHRILKNFISLMKISLTKLSLY